MDSAAFRQRARHVMLSDDPDTATEQTVAEMARQIQQAARDLLVQQCAVNAVRSFRGGPGWIGAGIDPFSNLQCMAESCWWWCKHFLRFVHHGSMFEAWSADLGDPRTKLQLLIAPDVLVRMRRMEGDCAIYTMMLCAMLASLGIQFEIVTLAVDQMQPEIFSHVFARAVMPNGRRESLDASHGDYPGWQVPARDIHREWTFDSAGRRVGASPRFAGLHAYRRRRGFGDVCNEGDADYDPSACLEQMVPSEPSSQSGGTCPGSPGCPGYVDPATNAANNASLSRITTTVNGQTGYTAPSQSSAAWASFATAMAKAGFTLAEINAIQPGTVVSSNGSILRQSTGYSISGSSSTSTTLSTNTLMYLGIGAVAVVLVLSMSKGR